MPASVIQLTDVTRWDYVLKHDIQLPDEYDSIHERLEYLWGLDPLELQEQESAYETARSDSFTIGKLTEDDPFTLLNTSVPPERQDDGFHRGVARNIKMMTEVERDLPPFRAVFTPNDNPNQVIDYHIQERLVQAAREGKSESSASCLPVNAKSHDFVI